MVTGWRRALWILPFLTGSGMAMELEESRVIPANGHYEQCLRLSLGQALGWRFVSSQALDFNIHDHIGGGTNYHVRDSSAMGEGGFTPSRPGVYCAMWENPGQIQAEVAITLQLQAQDN